MKYSPMKISPFFELKIIAQKCFIIALKSWGTLTRWTKITIIPTSMSPRRKNGEKRVTNWRQS